MSRGRRLLFFVLARATDASFADSVLGDLEQLRRARGGFGSTLWFWRTALGILFQAITMQLREALIGFRVFRDFGSDWRHALQSLRRRPGLAAAIVLLLALGLGANTAVFSIVQAVLLRPLPYAEPERLVFIWGGTELSSAQPHRILSATQVIEIARQQPRTLDGFAAFKTRDIGLDSAVDLLRSEGSERLRGAHVTPNFFELLGVQAAFGRAFASTDNDAHPAVVISHGLWQRGFGGSSTAVGTQIAIASGRETRTRRAYTIIGVLPPEFHFTYPEQTEIYLLMPWERLRPNRILEYGVAARLKHGITPLVASAELTEIARDAVRTHGTRPEQKDALQRTGMLAEPMRAHMVAEVKPGLTVLAWVAGIVLLIACVNIGLLMVSRTIDRGGELAVRAALGAGPSRIVRLLFVEGILLASIGGVAGVAAAYLVMPVVRSLMPPVVPRLEDIGVDPAVLLFALGVTVMSALVCGITPTLVMLRGDLLAAVRRTGGTTTSDRKLVVVRLGVVGIQVALVLVLLVGAGLLLNSFWRMTVTPLGFDGTDVLTFEVRLLNPKYREHAARRQFAQRTLAEIKQLQGVAAVAVSTAVPMRGVDFIRDVKLPGGRTFAAYVRSVDPAFFSILDIPLVEGRRFTPSDSTSGRAVVVASERLADMLFGREPAVGRELVLHDGQRGEIIGVVADMRYADVRKTPAPALYTVRSQYPSELQCFLVKPEPNAKQSVALRLSEVVRRVDPDQPIEGLTTVGSIVLKSTSDRRFYALVTGAFAAVALLLAVAGLFGVVSRAVTERRRELAVRAALGADHVRILRLVLTHGLLPVVFGCLGGIAMADIASRMVQSLVFEISVTDPLTYAAAASLVLLAALLACVVPGIRAVRLDLVSVLRGD